MAAIILTPADAALELGTDARTMRKFLRSITPKDAQPGKGSRWEIKKAEMRSLRKKFTEFQNAENERKNARIENAKNAQVEAEVENEENEVENEPTDAELMALDNEN